MQRRVVGAGVVSVCGGRLRWRWDGAQGGGCLSRLDLAGISLGSRWDITAIPLLSRCYLVRIASLARGYLAAISLRPRPPAEGVGEHGHQEVDEHHVGEQHVEPHEG